MKTEWNYHALWRQLVPLYDAREAQALVRALLQDGHGLSMADVLTDGVERLPQERKERLVAQMEQLYQAVPVQQVLGFAWFCNRRFAVSPDVLTPRPETEELCRWILQGGEEKDVVALLDVGTGSGCIACTLAAEQPEARVTGWDVSAVALEIARENAKRTNVHVSFEQVDVLRRCRSIGDKWDFIVSNPPYVCKREKAAMERNVLDYEPHLALFVPDDDPLLFYRAIAAYGQEALKPGGWLYFELNPLYASDVQRLLSMMLYHNIETKEDQFGKQRMIRAKR